MDIDGGTIAAALMEGPEAVRRVRRYDLGARFLKGQSYRKAWFAIDAHVRQYGEVPTRDALKKAVPEVRIPDNDKVDALEFYVAELKYRDRQDRWEQLGPDIGDLVQKRSFDAAAEKVKAFVRDLEESMVTDRQAVRSIFELVPAVKQRYLDVKAGKIGIPYKWEGLNEITMGTDLGDMNGFVGRLGTGKTQCLLINAHHVWKKGEDLNLFISPEMKQVPLAQRFFTLDLHLPPGLVRRARLDDFLAGKFFDELDGLAGKGGFYLVADEFRITLDLIEAAIDHVLMSMTPEERKTKRLAVWMDGAYLALAARGLSRQENAEMMADGLADLSRRKGIGMNFSSQFNRTVTRNDIATLGAEGIGLTDAFGWIASNLFGLFQDDDMLADKELILKGLKVRESRGRDEIRLHWDWDRNEFEEISAKPQKFKDDEYARYGNGVAAPAATGDDDEIPF